jgi:ribonucleotide monophosphatase NagD (HAD superfamily)
VLFGDNLEADIAGGAAVGIAGVLTLTGVSRRRDIAAVPEHLRPVEVVEDLTRVSAIG